ncbi:nucleoside transporter 4 [Plasmodium gaboni]|uniref:Nucleoside transporter 4 n=1 Tax=Plasmodium gaboni TaxID=647221 RepID=A0A151LWX1_9APIC|nr:nucleoside transporter 4 [Plasmodium gaboni]KYO03678.1 nucleoside transporter 4 [Plasmodium gaboni]SOV10084.1 nucleoside transporter 4 [Plasmodium gaboni]SOV20476.1 nucleoside transporter 4 [Plasmodium sp. DRC-Itaito]
MLKKSEETKIKVIFFFIGLLLSLPSHILINVSFLINHIYKEEIAITVMGFLSGFMIISSFLQLTFEFTSFKWIMICNGFNVFNLLLLLIFVCVMKCSKYYIYGISGLIGFFIGYLYSSCTKYTLLFPLKVNSYMVTGISFSSLFFFGINLLMSYFSIEDGNINSYYNTIYLSIGTIVFIEFIVLITIIFIQYNSPFFKEQKEKIESAQNIKCLSYSASNYLCDVEKGKNKSTENIQTNNVSMISKFKNKIKTVVSMFNCANIIEGACLIRYYYLCLIPIFFSFFVTCIIYPHMIPNKLNKNVYYKYLFMFLYQLSDLIFHIIVTVYYNAFNFFKQKYVAILCLSRVFLLLLSFKIKNLTEESFLYSNTFISFLIFVIGGSNGALINISYARIADCFEESTKKTKQIAVASSFCALCLLMSFALAPWFCHAIIHL